MGLRATVDVAFPLRLTLADGATDQYAQAKVYDQAGSLLATVSLPHIAGGLYGADWTPAAVGHVAAVFTVFTDSGFTTPASYDKQGEDIEVTTTLSTELLDSLLEDHLVADSVGESFSLIRGLVQHNFMLDNPTYNADGLLTAARIRIFPTAADTDAETNALATYAVESVEHGDDASKPLSYKSTRTA